MINELIKIAKSLDGTVLTLGFETDSKLIKTIENNKKITFYSCLTDLDKKKKDKKEKKKFFSNNTIDKKKLYKSLKKQKYDYLLCDFNLIKPFFNNFIKNSNKLTNKKIYFILDNKVYDYEEIEKRYNRYNASSIAKGSNDSYLIEIDVAIMKMTLFKRFIYSFRDTFYNIVEFIASVIIS
ncbi:MAG TPA: hypothetical protein PLV83_02305 [Bacilli bacterium]|nr:hypothetical protein [Bacilli bacterium]